MTAELTRKRPGPRTYIVVKNPKTGKATGMTIRGMESKEVIEKLEAVFSPQPAQPIAA